MKTQFYKTPIATILETVADENNGNFLDVQTSVFRWIAGYNRVMVSQITDRWVDETKGEVCFKIQEL
ncbi:MAG: hypothetical protein ACYTFK_13775 [Planctomycetota bacterium]|jgi:hypothetical protein